MLIVYATFLFLYFLLDPAPAYAWGPLTHLEIASTVLKNAAWCAPLIRNLIQAYPAEFIYGNVSPDIIVGKKYAGAMHHCHNWSIGKLILEEAKTDMDRAAAWGYLTHLAADCVAHNYFVPYKMIQSFERRTLGHVYWEIRFDLFVPEHCHKELSRVIHHDFTSFDHLLNRVLKKTLFSFSTNKKIFNSILILHKMKHLRSGLQTYTQATRWALTPARVKHYKDLVFDVVKGFLSHPERAKCLKADPAGLRKLKYAYEIQSRLKKIDHPDDFIHKVQFSLETSLYDPEKKLPNV